MFIGIAKNQYKRGVRGLSDLRLLARLKLKSDKVLKGFIECLQDFVTQVILAFFLVFINYTKALKELDYLSKYIPFNQHILLLAFKDLEAFLIIGSSTYTRSLIQSRNRIKHLVHRESINPRYLRLTFVQLTTFSRTILGLCFPN